MSDELKQLIDATQRAVEDAMRRASGPQPVSDAVRAEVERAMAEHRAACEQAQEATAGSRGAEDGHRDPRPGPA
jgi:hypothetical protein